MRKGKGKLWRIISLVFWIVATVVSVITMPNLDQLVREKGQITIPASAQSEVAKEMMSKMDESGGETYQIIAVFTSNSNQALTDKQKEEIHQVIDELKKNDQELGIKEILSHLDNEKLEEQLVSEDKTTILTQIYVDKKHGTISDIVNDLYQATTMKDVKTYLTGNEVVMEDFVKSTQDGVKKTEIIAVIFIIVVLIIVFRSPIIPVVSLLSVGVSYLISMGIITNLVDKFNYPFSNFTQVFVVVILFGIGTDYNILLFTRFREELSKQDNALLAMKQTFKEAGKTVLFSGLAVFIGFVALILAQFRLYQATSAVAIGIAVLLLVLMTLNPFFMVLLGKKLFYPMKGIEGHKDSRVWAFLSKNSVGRPLVSLLFVGILCVPFILIHTGNLNFNSLIEVGDSYESKQGVKVIEEHFSKGFSSPATLMIESDTPLDNQKALQSLDEIAERISQVNGVAKVYTPTRPTGEKITELYINDQTDQLYTGLDEAKNGIGQINTGLSSAEGQINVNSVGDLSKVHTLINGTGDVKSALSTLNGAMNQVTKGMNKGANGAGEIEKGLGLVNESLDNVSKGITQLGQGYSELEQGLSLFGTYFASIGQGIEGSQQGFALIEASMSNLIAAKPELANDPNVQKTIGIAKSGQEQLGKLLSQLNQLAAQYQSAMNSFKEANASLNKVNEGLTQIKNGVTTLQAGAAELKDGLNNGANGSSQINSNVGKLESGIGVINNGQKQLLTGLNGFQEKIGLLKTGLIKSTDGLTKVTNGLTDAQSYLKGLSQSKASEKFYIPQDVLEGADFQKGLDTYMSNDRKSAKMMIILDVNPYAKEAMPIIEEINNQVNAALKGSDLSGAKAAIGGKSSQNVDLEDIANSDFLRTAIIMLIGIGLVLLYITRSFWNTVFILSSLLLAYFTSLGITEIISTYLLGLDSLSWNVPFFSFIMIVALGVDYSIFFMMRYRELGDTSPQGIVKAAAHIGGVVISAAIILGGTFAALIPSGIVTLIQVATMVMVGLVFLSMVMLPILIPTLMFFMTKIKPEKNTANQEILEM